MVELALSLVLLGKPLDIKFDGVIDNRCPLPPISCASAGLAEARFTLPGGTKITLVIPGAVAEAPAGIFTAGADATNFFRVGNRAFLFKRLDPLPTPNEKPTKYKATIVESPPPIGVAMLDRLETVTLRLEGKNPVVIPKGDKRYYPVLRHLGGLYVGREKPVLPGPDVEF